MRLLLAKTLVTVAPSTRSFLLKIHHRPYTKGMLGFPCLEITPMGEKVLVCVIKAVLRQYEDVVDLAKPDLVIHRQGNAHQGLRHARGKTVFVAIPLHPQRWFKRLVDPIAHPTG